MSHFKTQGFARVKDREKRREVRYPSDTEVIVFCGNEFFKTRTLNVSNSGILLWKPLPIHFLGKELQVVVSSKSKGQSKSEREVLYQGSLIGDFLNRLCIKKIA